MKFQMAAINSKSLKLLLDCNLELVPYGRVFNWSLSIVSRGQIPAAQHLLPKMPVPVNPLQGTAVFLALVCTHMCWARSVYSLTTAQCLLLRCRGYCATRAQPALVVFDHQDLPLKYFALQSVSRGAEFSLQICRLLSFYINNFSEQVRSIQENLSVTFKAIMNVQGGFFNWPPLKITSFSR